MEGYIERESGALGGLFHHIIHDMKNGTPLWEDFIAKASKLHSSLRATILAVTAYLEAFQKIADSATNTRGATREIGTALTRICLRHKAVEVRMKTFTNTIMDMLIIPLQEKLEEWKKTVLNLDKEHAKDNKRARSELKKRSTDTMRLQKKIRKCASGVDLQKRLECGLQDVNERKQLLEETEKHAVRAALIEERGRFCAFVDLLKPVVDEEVAMLSEISHLQEAVQQLEKHTVDPKKLPPASEQVIADLKSSDSGWSFQTPPSSPSSLGSRKSSMCSISSLNSSSSGSSKSNHSPSHPHWQRSLSQPVGRSGTIRYMSVSSQDSGFTSQDTLYLRPPSSMSVAKVSNMSENSGNTSSSSTPCTLFPASVNAPINTTTWPNLQETLQFEKAASAIINDRPHTISSAYEKGHQRPPLTVFTFQAPEHQSLSQPASPVTSITPTSESVNNNIASNLRELISTNTPSTPFNSFQQGKPPLPTRCSSLERTSGPNVPAKTIIQGVRVLPPNASEHSARKKSQLTIPAQLAKIIPQPTYVNMHELASMVANKAQDMSTVLPPPPSEFVNSPATDKPHTEGEKDGSTSESSLESSSGYGSQTTFSVEEAGHNTEDFTQMVNKYCTLPRNKELNFARPRPHSMAALYSNGTIRSHLLRRSSMQTTNKPPPPIRRTSSITNQNNIIDGTGSVQLGSLENLPPPPAFLLEPQQTQEQFQQQPQNSNKSSITGIKVAETVKALTELRHTPASPNSIRRMSTSTHSIYQQSGAAVTTTPLPSTPPVLSSFQQQNQQKVSYISQSGGVVYAQPSKPSILSGGSASPSSVRRFAAMHQTGLPSQRSQSADRKDAVTFEGGGVNAIAGGGFMSNVTMKMIPNLSPRAIRRRCSIEDGAGVGIGLVGKGDGGGLQQLPLVKGTTLRGPGQSFLDSLNEKLAQQHICMESGGGNLGQSGSIQQQKADRIRKIFNNKSQPDPKVCHESLMDQIKRGSTLKRTKTVNDRSAPKMY